MPLRSHHVLARATRSVIEPLEGRRLLAKVTGLAPIDNGQHLSVTFNAPVSLPDSAYRLTDLKQLAKVGLPGQGPIDPSVPLTVVPVSATKMTLKPNLPGTTPIARLLPNGWYEAAVRDNSVVDDGTNEKPVRVLNGDLDGNGVVNFDDFTVLCSNFGQTGKTYAQGDLDYTGTVDYDDYTLLQFNYGLSLPSLPTVPGQVAVSNATPGRLSVSWAASATEPRDGFKIYRSADGQTFDLVAPHVAATAQAWEDPATDLTLGKKYWYRVRSYTTANGASAAVTKAAAIVTQPIFAPTNPRAAGIGPGRVLLQWTAPADPQVTGYRVYRSRTANFTPSPATLAATVPNKLRMIDSGLSRGHTYYYKVVAVGLGGIASAPSPEVAVVAQNAGSGFSNAANNYLPFDPATHDSDNDGTPDGSDTDHDNDGTPDEQDSDDDNNGTNDNAEPDDRDTDEDGTADNSDPDDDSDGTPDAEDTDDDDDGTPDEDDPSTGDVDVVASRPGLFHLFHAGQGPYYENAVFSEYYVPEDADEDSPPIPRLSFGGDEANGSQTITFSNVPKHAFLSLTGDLLYTGTDPSGGDGKFSVKLNGTELLGNVPSGHRYIEYSKTIESTDDTVTLTFSGSSLTEKEGWSINNYYLNVTLPQVSIANIGAGTIMETELERRWDTETGTEVETDELKKAKFRVSRTGPAIGDLDVDLDWADGGDGIADPGSDATVKNSVTIPDGEQYVDFDIVIKDDPDAEGVEALKGFVVNQPENNKYFSREDATAEIAINDNASISSIYISRDPDNSATQTFNGFNFVAKIKIAGESLSSIRLKQEIKSFTTVTMFDGRVADATDLGPGHATNISNSIELPENAATGGWGLDEVDNKYIEWNQLTAKPLSKDGIVEYVDWHRYEAGTLPAPGAGEGAKYSYLAQLGRQLRMSFLDSNTNKIFNEKATWGFNWSNWTSIWRPSDTPKPPADVTFGAACNFMSSGPGYFSGQNGLDNFPFPVMPL